MLTMGPVPRDLDSMFLLKERIQDQLFKEQRYYTIMTSFFCPKIWNFLC